MQGLDVRLIGRFDSTCAAIKHVGSAFQQLPFPFRHLIWMDFVLLGDFRQRLILNEQQSRTQKRRLAKLSSQKSNTAFTELLRFKVTWSGAYFCPNVYNRPKKNAVQS